MTRRNFIAAGASAPAALASAAPGPAIRKIEIFPLVYPVNGFFKFFTKPERPAVFVKITTEDGATGWGQSVPIQTWSYETLESAAGTLRDYLAPALIGHDALDLEGVHKVMNKTIAPSFSTGMPIAKAGIDLALHDLAGKLARKSLPELWGRKPIDRITLSWTVNVKTLDEIDGQVDEGKKRGYQNFNIKVAPDPKFDVQLARRVRHLVPKGFLWADANGGYDIPTALEAIPKLRDAGVDILEQPVAANRLSGFAAARKLGALPILMDEGLVSSVELEEFIHLGLLDGAAMKPQRTAGLWDARKQVELLEKYNLRFLGSGLTDPDVSLAASLALYGAYQLKYPAALNGLQYLSGSFLKQPFRLVNGTLAVPTGPGLGVEVDEDAVRRAARS